MIHLFRANNLGLRLLEERADQIDLNGTQHDQVVIGVLIVTTLRDEDAAVLRLDLN